MTEKIPKKTKKILKIIGGTVCSCIAILSVVVMYIRGVPTEEVKECYKIAPVGEYSIDGGNTFNTFDNVIYIKSYNSDEMIIRGHFDREIPAGEMIHFYLTNDELTLSVNGKAVYVKGANRDNPWNTYITTDTIKCSDNIEMKLKSQRHHVFNQSFPRTYGKIYIGSKFGLLKTMLLRNSVQILGCILVAVLGFAIMLNRLSLDKYDAVDKEGMITLGVMLIVCAATCFIDYEFITLINPNYFSLKYVDALTQAMSTIFISLNFVKYIYEEKAKRRFRHLIWVMVGLTALYVVWQMIYATGADGEINLFSFLTVFGAILVAAQLVIIFSSVSDMSKFNRISFDTSLCLVAAALFEIVHFILTGEYLVYILFIALVVFSILQYNLIIMNNAKNLKEAQKAYVLEQELTDNQIKMMLSQIQPHFLYNALGTIRALCVRNPKEARSAMDHFAKYLRANMDSLNEHWCIPFTKELEHVKSYLYIEKLRFEDKLNIEYDIRTTDFMIPPLALQTMVENAVKHGLLPKEEGGTIKISAFETDTCFEVVVADDGVGFDQAVKTIDTGRSHIGVANTRQRIMGMCNGSLNIGSRSGEGTTITITLPKMSNKMK